LVGQQENQPRKTEKKYNKNYSTECIIMFMSKMNNSMKGPWPSPRIPASWPGQDALPVPRRGSLFQEAAASDTLAYKLITVKVCAGNKTPDEDIPHNSGSRCPNQSHLKAFCGSHN